jgi:hypothetical protein
MNVQSPISVIPRIYGPVWIASSCATIIEDKYTCIEVLPSGVGTAITWARNEFFLSSEKYFYFNTYVAQMYDSGIPYPMSDVWLADPSFGVYNIIECKFHEYTFEPSDYKGTSLIHSASSSAPDSEDPDFGLVGPVEINLKYGNMPYSAGRIVSKETTVERAMSIVADAFAEFSEVSRIYMQRWRSELQFVVLLNTEKYDSDLIDRLLDVEYDLLRYETEGLLWDFAYLPCKGRDSTEEVSSSATVVFSR